jgi:hypothetical protein
LPHRQPLFGGQQAIRTDLALPPWLLAPLEAQRLLRVRQALQAFWLWPSPMASPVHWLLPLPVPGRQVSRAPSPLPWLTLVQLALLACSPSASPLAAWPWLLRLA